MADKSDNFPPEEANFGDLKCMVIVVNKGIKQLGAYEAVRGVWRVKIDRARQAEYVFATDRGVIIGAFEPDEWYPVNEENRHLVSPPHSFLEDRSFFVGKKAPQEIWNAYVGKRFTRKKGARNPFRYINI